MLPSTFRNDLKHEEELKKKLKAKLEVARFLQDTVRVMAKGLKQSRSGYTRDKADKLYDFMKRVRSGDATVTNDDISKFATLFGDEFTLDHISRGQLANMCRFVGIAPYGSTFTSHQLSQKLPSLKNDDRVIKQDGIALLSLEELKSANRARGMRADTDDRAILERQLEDWLDLTSSASFPFASHPLQGVYNHARTDATRCRGGGARAGGRGRRRVGPRRGPRQDRGGGAPVRRAQGDPGDPRESSGGGGRVRHGGAQPRPRARNRWPGSSSSWSRRRSSSRRRSLIASSRRTSSGPRKRLRRRPRRGGGFRRQSRGGDYLFDAHEKPGERAAALEATAAPESASSSTDPEAVGGPVAKSPSGASTASTACPWTRWNPSPPVGERSGRLGSVACSRLSPASPP